MGVIGWTLVALQLIAILGLFAFLFVHSLVIRSMLQELAGIVRKLEQGSRALERRIDRYYEEERDGRRETEGTAGAKGTGETKTD